MVDNISNESDPQRLDVKAA